MGVEREVSESSLHILRTSASIQPRDRLHRRRRSHLALFMAAHAVGYRDDQRRVRPCLGAVFTLAEAHAHLPIPADQVVVFVAGAAPFFGTDADGTDDADGVDTRRAHAGSNR